MPETVEELRKKIIEKAKDPVFKARLMDKNTTKDALKEMGIIIPEGIKVTVYQETEDHFYLILPMNPEEDHHHHYHNPGHCPPLTW